MKICIIGSGITGLTAGRVLSKNYDVTIYEKKSDIGGIARTKDVNGTTYHTVGGHCLNSKNKEVMEFVFNEVLPKEDWHLVKRDAKINFRGRFISYPIEFSIKEIAEFDEDLAFQMTIDFLSTEDKKTDNLALWFEAKFGKTLAQEYFIPYNKKIWGKAPSEMSHLWVEGKLPLPNKKDFFDALIGVNKDTMPHSTFYYPNSNTQNTFIEALGKGLRVVTDCSVDTIEKIKGKWLINNSQEYDFVINTMPLDKLPFALKDVPNEIKNEAKKLKYNKITNMLWKTKDIDFTWSYYPSEDTIFHRHIHIGNFFSKKQNVTITECMGERSYDEMERAGREFDYLLEPLDYNVSDYAYVVYDQNHAKSTKSIKNYCEKVGIYSIGRFGEWEYYNMDICMQAAFEVSDKLRHKIETAT